MEKEKKKLWDILTQMFEVEREKGVYDAETKLPQSVGTYGAGYIDKCDYTLYENIDEFFDKMN